MTDDILNEIIYYDINKVVELTKKYKELLESGLTYEQLQEMIKTDADLFKIKELMLRDIHSCVDESLIDESEKILISKRQNNIENALQTNITSTKDLAEKKLALRYANELLYEE